MFDMKKETLIRTTRVPGTWYLVRAEVWSPVPVPWYYLVPNVCYVVFPVLQICVLPAHTFKALSGVTRLARKYSSTRANVEDIIPVCFKIVIQRAYRQ